MQEVLKLNKMSVSEKLHVINQIWESLEPDSEKVPSPEWHKNILSNRIEKVKNGTAKFKSFDIVKQELQSKFK